ncbi:MAG: hypothetical protein K0R63_1494 [Rickettsiales bacterium]|jgi:uncharacterized membrane protein|nr:hypothetical protein [Rickettsiales bacterium]
MKSFGTIIKISLILAIIGGIVGGVVILKRDIPAPVATVEKPVTSEQLGLNPTQGAAPDATTAP